MTQRSRHISASAPLVARVFAWGGLIVTLVGGAAAIALRIVDPAPIVQNTFGFADTSLVGFVALGITFAAVGALLTVRLPTNAVGWVMVGVGVCYALAALTAATTFSAMAAGPEMAGLAAFSAWLAVLFSTVGGLLFVLGFIFPTGRGHTPAWDRGIRIAAVASPFLLVVGFLARPGPLQVFPSIDNPFGIGPDLRPLFGPQPHVAIAAMAALVAPLLVWSIASRYRMADAIGRQQLKWFIVSMLVAVVGIGSATIAALLADRPPEVGLAVFGFAGALVPIAIGIAILRYNLYDIDRLVSRSIGWASVTAILVTVFGVAVVGLQAVLESVTQGDTVAIAASTLVALALFQPVRRRVQTAVDRRFDRARYDAERTAESFAARLRDELDLPTLTADLQRTADATVRPTSSVVWLRTSVH